MTKIGKSVIATLVLGILAVGLTGCQKKEGPAEKAGKAIDKAAEKVGEKVEKAGEKIKDVTKELKK